MFVIRLATTIKKTLTTRNLNQPNAAVSAPWRRFSHRTILLTLTFRWLKMQRKTSIYSNQVSKKVNHIFPPKVQTIVCQHASHVWCFPLKAIRTPLTLPLSSLNRFQKLGQLHHIPFRLWRSMYWMYFRRTIQRTFPNISSFTQRHTYWQSESPFSYKRFLHTHMFRLYYTNGLAVYQWSTN